MTSKTITLTGSETETFPDFPPRDDMQNWLYLYDTTIVSSLAIYFRDTPHTVVASEVPVRPNLPNREDARIPDLLVAFECDLELLKEQRGYSIRGQGGPPAFVLEVASPSTGHEDYTAKRLIYERYGIAEYWRFDPSGGEIYDAALAGDRLMDDGSYLPVEVERLGEGIWQGYSEALDLRVCWEHGLLRFHDPKTQSYLSSHEEERERAEAERVGRLEERARAEAERTGRLEAESRIAELEAELRRLRGQ